MNPTDRRTDPRTVGPINMTDDLDDAMRRAVSMRSLTSPIAAHEPQQPGQVVDVEATRSDPRIEQYRFSCSQRAGLIEPLVNHARNESGTAGVGGAA